MCTLDRTFRNTKLSIFDMQTTNNFTYEHIRTVPGFRRLQGQRALPRIRAHQAATEVLNVSSMKKL